MVHTARQERLRRPESHEWHTWIMVPTHFQHVVEKKLKNTSHESHTWIMVSVPSGQIYRLRLVFGSNNASNRWIQVLPHPSKNNHKM